MIFELCPCMYELKYVSQWCKQIGPYHLKYHSQQHYLISKARKSNERINDSEKIATTFELLIFVCCPIMCHYIVSSVLSCPLRLPDINDVRFVFTSSCLQKGSYLRCLCLLAHSGVQHILLCVFALCFVVVYVASFPGLSIFDCPFVIL